MTTVQEAVERLRAEANAYVRISPDGEWEGINTFAKVSAADLRTVLAAYSALQARAERAEAERDADREVVLAAQTYYANWCQDEADHPEITGCEPLQHEQAVALRDAFERRAAQHTAEALKGEDEDA